MGQFLIRAGALMVIAGLILHFRFEIPYLTGWLGKLPGDLVIKKGGVKIYFPLATSLVISALLSLLFKGSSK